MSALFNSYLTVVFLFFGIVATLIMLELRGAPKDRLINGKLILLHKISGWTFTSIFLVMLVVMVNKIAAYQEEVSPRTALHIAFALCLLTLLSLKIIAARFYPRFSKLLLGFAPFGLAMALTVSGLGAGYYFLHSDDLKYVSLTEFDTELLDESLGRQVVNQRCSKCHTLERIYRAFKSEEGWTTTINRMVERDPSISDFDIKQAIYFLTNRQNKMVKDDQAKLQKAIGMSIMETKCSVCHNLDRIIQADKDQEQWQSTIDRMIKNSGDPGYLSEQEKEELLNYLLSR